MDEAQVRPRIGSYAIADREGAVCAIACWSKDDPATMRNRGASAQGQIKEQFGELRMGESILND